MSEPTLPSNTGNDGSLEKNIVDLSVNSNINLCNSDMSENYEEMQDRIRSASFSIPAVYTCNPLSPNHISRKNCMSPVPPIRTNPISLFSPYKRPTSASPLLSPKFKSSEYDIDPFAIVHTQYMSIEKSSPRRPRSGSVGSSKSYRVASLPRRLSNSFISKVECKTRSRSVDLSSLSRPFSPSKSRTLSLLLEFQSERKGVVFQGNSLEELQNLINQSFLSLPLVRVCIEHPSIPNHLVNITDLDQLYDNAVIHLIPASQ